MTKSIAKSCPSCGALNRLVILSTGLTPAWRIGCSHCRAILIEPPRAQQRAGAEVIALPVPVAAARALAQPRGRRQLLPMPMLQRLPDRRAFSRACGSASTGVTFLAACGISMALLLPAGPPDPVQDGAGAPQPAIAAVAEVVPDLPSAGPEQADVVPAVPTPETELAAAVPDVPVPGELSEPGAPGRLPAIAPDLESPDGAAPDGLRNGTVAPWRAVAVAALGNAREAYPDPMEGMATLQVATADPKAAEEALDLSVASRREVQRRLHLAKYDPSGVDGIFGPATRSAIASWQEKAGLPATGYLNKRAFALLAEQTDSEYRTWLAAAKTRAAEERKFAALEPWPGSSRDAGSRCARSFSGKIAYGQSVGCDFRGLRENVAQLLGGAGIASRGTARRTPGA